MHSFALAITWVLLCTYSHKNGEYILYSKHLAHNLGVCSLFHKPVGVSGLKIERFCFFKKKKKC